MTNPTTDFWIEHLKLQPHPEGGWFREFYRSQEILTRQHLPERFSGNRNFSTAIYYLLQYPDFSAFHKIKSDEIWHFYAGDSLVIHIITPEGDYHELSLGSHPEKGEQLTGVVSQGCWFAASPKYAGAYALVGCTVSPGFDFSDFELANRSEILKLFPLHQKIITEFTREK
ncbi:MAG: cupin domain-containing protein [Lentimicrobiaceae bacterium]|jgi:hypothetical protein|nr:cupin domain-containing protein [Lentimicrobiaceae bacterium]